MNIVSLANIKTFLGIFTDADNDRITLLAEQAEGQVTKYIGWECWLDDRDFVVNLNYSSYWMSIPVLKLNSIDEITLDDIDVSYDRFDGNGLIYSSFRFISGQYEITASTGYEDIPTDIQKAVCLLVSNAYHQSQALASESLGDRNQVYEIGLPSQVKQLLSSHRVSVL